MAGAIDEPAATTASQGSGRVFACGLYGGTLLVSASLLMFEVGLTRLFSVTMWYHYAFLAVSTAMFGLALGAVLVYLQPERFAPRSLPGLALVQGLGMQAATVIALTVPVGTGFGRSALARVALVYLALLVPFTAGGTALTVLLTRFPGYVARVYAADLAGAAAGALGALAILSLVATPKALLLFGVVGALGAALLALATPGSRRIAAFGLLATTATAAVLAATGLATLHWTKNPMGAGSATTALRRAEWEGWNSYAHVSILPRGPEPFGWSLSRRAPPIAVEQKLLVIDAAAATVLTRFDHRDLGRLEHLDYDVTALAHALRPGGRTLVIGVGGGRDVLTALRQRPQRVVGVEVNGLILELLGKGRYADFTGRLGEMPGVTLVHDEARAYLAKSHARFDVIQGSLIDTWAATASGAFALTENGLYTLEAFALFLDRLDGRGLLSVSRWYVPRQPGELLRLIALAATALERRGADAPGRHLFVAATPLGADGAPFGVASVLLSPEPLGDGDVAAALAWCASREFLPLYAAGRSAPPGAAPAPLLADLADLVDPERRALAIARHPLDLAPPSDDRPFFFNMLRLGQALGPEGRALAGETNLGATRLLVQLLLFVTLLAAALLLAPFVVARGAAATLRLVRRDFAFVAYFAAIGLGFIHLEIGQMQRLSLFLGQPTYALAVVLAGILAAAGLGSWVAGRLRLAEARPERLALAGPALLAVLAPVVYATPAVIRALAGSSDPVRIAASLALVAVPGFFLGMPFPIGMGLAQRSLARESAWLWGLNGALSVVGSVLAVVLAIGFGITDAMAVGLLAYAVAALALPVMARRASAS